MIHHDRTRMRSQLRTRHHRAMRNAIYVLFLLLDIQCWIFVWLFRLQKLKPNEPTQDYQEKGIARTYRARPCRSCFS